MKGNITIKDVAKRAGVSISTVSRVINDSKPVTDEVKQKVLDVIKETGYIPNPLARSLVTKKSQLIGVIVPEVSDSFVNEILNGIEEIAKMYDYEILLANTYSDKEQELKSINLLRAKQVEGIVMISWKVEKEHVDYMQRLGIPASYISKTAREYDIHTVSTSNIDATYDMTKYLLDKGHEKIAFIMTSEDDTVLERERLTGYEKALNERNIKIDKDLKIGYMLQHDSLFEWRNILNNCLLGLEINKTLNEDNKNKVINLLNLYGLKDFIYSYPDNLSGGMRQRVALIRTLANNPNLLLMDEPFSALDYQSRLAISDDIYNILKKEKKTMIMVTHDIAEAISMCDKVIVLSSRPSTIKSIYEIKLDKKSTPINNRKDKMFSYYYDKIWKDIDFHVQ